MQSDTMVFSAELAPQRQKNATRAERHALDHLREDYHHLLVEANQIHTRLQASRNHFDFLANTKEIDACIFQIRTDQCRYEATLGKLREIQTRMQNLIEQ